LAQQGTTCHKALLVISTPYRFAAALFGFRRMNSTGAALIHLIAGGRPEPQDRHLPEPS